ncbi:amino acid ABC transporter permease [Pelagibacterium sp. H642]|uniref:amino acid ABC transporter permease n=1 Tax=Pelagibacterium sp. H642 TaxID=1881069 RepID=UPI002814CF7E|nr:amino acid ABC transporter permease [Pelagibacterium sp. H642]WMT91904.1 amino acid ABC transporter permease [Pelagibacterium sp. H642]
MNGLEFSGTISRLDLLVAGAWTTVWISGASMVLGLLIGLVCAVAMGVSRPVRLIVLIYIEIIRNTPFLVQLFVVYFGLPSLGIRLSPVTSAIIGLSIYGGAYLAEIIRAGIDNVPPGPIEAARALGMRGPTIFRSIVLKPALASIFPALSGQFVLLLQSSSLLSAISVAELTGAGNDIQSLTVRNFEAFVFVAGFYILLTTGFRLVFAAIARMSFRFKYPAR